MSFQQFNIALQKTTSDQIKYRKYRKQILRAQGKLPGEMKMVNKRLAETREYMRKVGELRKKENAQHGDIDKQVKGQAAKIVSAGKDLERQAGEARLNIGKYRNAAFEQKRLAVANHQDLVRRFWRDTVMGLEVLTLKNGQLDLMMFRALGATSRALSGMRSARYRVIYPQLPVVTKEEMPPSWGEVKAADGRIAHLKKVAGDQEIKIAKAGGKLRDHAEKLKKDSAKAHAKADAAVAQRGQQLIKGQQRMDKLRKHGEYIKKRDAELAGKKAQVGDVQGQLARRRANLLRGRAKAVARSKYDAQLGAYQKKVAAYKKAAAAAKKNNKRPPRPPAAPTFPQWYMNELKRRTKR